MCFHVKQTCYICFWRAAQGVAKGRDIARTLLDARELDDAHRHVITYLGSLIRYERGFERPAGEHCRLSRVQGIV